MKHPTDRYQDIRDAVRDLCAQFPDDHHRRIDEVRGYPEAFVDAPGGCRLPRRADPTNAEDPT